ncbi:MAG TPA: L,D-transpeptidase [Longimicrobium sp.]|nr:L,D-transpeptidase [Longimicrobium sp.]
MFPQVHRFRARGFALLSALCIAAPAMAQAPRDTVPEPEDNRPRGLVTREELMADRLRRIGVDNPDPAPTAPRNRADSVEWARWRRVANAATGRRIVVSIYDRKLWLIDGRDTLIEAAAGVGMGIVRGPLGIGMRDFSTPRGRRTVLAKQENPLWVPPDWHYEGLHDGPLRQFPAAGIRLEDGSRVVRRGRYLGVQRGTQFDTIPAERPLVYGGVMYIPPFGTVNRQIPEVLGKFKLDTGDGILIHGTNDPLAVGFWGTHGCVRLFDDDIEFVFANAPVGTPVYIY